MSARPIRHPVLRDAVWERRRFLRSLGLGSASVALGSGLLAACGGDDDDPSPRRGGGGGGGGAQEAAASIKPYDPAVPYWEQGNFAAVSEELTETALEVSGSIPSELSGLYVRNGSNPTSLTSPHWFLGDGMIHGVRIEGGSASWYRNRWVNTTLRQEGKDFAEAGAPGKDVNQSNVAIVHHAGKLLTLGEVGWPYELSTEDLSTVGPWDFAGKLATWMTAHPKVDPDTGNMHFFGYGIVDPKLAYHVADPSGQLVLSEPVAMDVTTMIHDFAITDQDVVFWQGPVMFGSDPSGNGDPSFPFYWDPAGPSRVGVMPLGGPASAIRWVDIEPCMVFHGLNAHRDGDDVVLHVHRLSSAFGPEGDLVPSRLTEWRLGTAGEQLTFREERLSDRDMDLPTIDRRHTGRASRHGWFATIDNDGPYGFEFAGIAHRDSQTGKEQAWEPGEMERAGEAFFAPGDDGEGEGWLLSFLYDRTTDRSSLGIFDAQSVADGPLARIHLPARVPYGFHGLWIGEDDLA